jgi:hypothetical protein
MCSAEQYTTIDFLKAALKEWHVSAGLSAYNYIFPDELIF